MKFSDGELKIWSGMCQKGFLQGIPNFEGNLVHSYGSHLAQIMTEYVVLLYLYVYQIW